MDLDVHMCLLQSVCLVKGHMLTAVTACVTPLSVYTFTAYNFVARVLPDRQYSYTTYCLTVCSAVCGFLLIQAFFKVLQSYSWKFDAMTSDLGHACRCFTIRLRFVELQIQSIEHFPAAEYPSICMITWQQAPDATAFHLWW